MSGPSASKVTPEATCRLESGRYGEQDEAGVDVSLLRYMLGLSPVERLRCMERHAADTLRLLEHGRQHRQTKAAQGR